MELIRPDVNIDFVGKRKWAFLASGLLILMTIVSLVAHGGPNYGIDFAGGILVQVRFKAPVEPEAISRALEPIGMGAAVIQRFGSPSSHEYLIRAEKEGLKLEGLAQRVRQALARAFGKGKFEVRRVEMVGPKVGRDLREKALLAIFYAIVLIAVYISGRFEGKWILAAVMAGVLVGATLLVEGLISAWGGGGSGIVPLIVTALVVTVGACWVLGLRYALGAIVALIHDVVITVGVFSVLDKEFTLPIVAALLTIIGYSLNDTIIVFDRIRENLRRNPRRELALTINEAINQTLSRTILTSGTTLIVLVCLYLLGGGVIEDFALALLVGVVVGTYSSIFVASPVILALPSGGLLEVLRARGPARPAPPPARPAPAPSPGPAPAQSQAPSRSKKRKKKKKKKRSGRKR